MSESAWGERIMRVLDTVVDATRIGAVMAEIQAARAAIYARDRARDAEADAREQYDRLGEQWDNRDVHETEARLRARIAIHALRGGEFINTQDRLTDSSLTGMRVPTFATVQTNTRRSAIDDSEQEVSEAALLLSRAGEAERRYVGLALALDAAEAGRYSALTDDFNTPQFQSPDTAYRLRKAAREAHDEAEEAMLGRVVIDERPFHERRKSTDDGEPAGRNKATRAGTEYRMNDPKLDWRQTVRLDAREMFEMPGANPEAPGSQSYPPAVQNALRQLPTELLAKMTGLDDDRLSQIGLPTSTRR